jgi:hypothetical protein
MNVYGGIVVTRLQKYTQESRQAHAVASLHLGDAVPCTYYLIVPQNFPERVFRASAGIKH